MLKDEKVVNTVTEEYLFVRSKVAPTFYINRAGQVKDSNGHLVKLNYVPPSGYMFRETLKNSRGKVKLTYRGNPQTKSHYIHRLLAQQFLKIPPHLKHKDFNSLAVLFKDGNSMNYAVDNLYIDSRSNNNKKCYKENCSGPCITVKAKNFITNEVIEYYSIAECARQHKVSVSSLEKILHREKLFTARVGNFLFRKSRIGIWPILSKADFNSLRQLKLKE